MQDWATFKKQEIDQTNRLRKQFFESYGSQGRNHCRKIDTQINRRDQGKIAHKWSLIFDKDGQKLKLYPEYRKNYQNSVTTLCTKGHIQQNEKTTHRIGKNICKSDKGLISKTGKEFLQLNN